MIESQSEEQLLRKQLFAFLCSKLLVHSMKKFFKKIFNEMCYEFCDLFRLAWFKENKAKQGSKQRNQNSKRRIGRNARGNFTLSYYSINLMLFETCRPVEA